MASRAEAAPVASAPCHGALDVPDGMDEPQAPHDAADRPVDAASTGAPRPADALLAQWIQQVADRDERALAALYDATAARVLASIRRVLRRDALAEEALEDTYWQVWREAPRFDPDRGAPMAWLMTIARSRAIDHHRRACRCEHEILDETSTPGLADAGVPSAEDAVDLTRRQQQLRAAMQHLDAQPRQLVALAFYRGCTHDEIALQTGLPLGTVKSQIRRALIQLRQWLDAPNGPDWTALCPEECP